MPRNLGFLETFPVLAALPTSVGSGRIVTLSTDGHPYFDHLTGWQRMDVQVPATSGDMLKSVYDSNNDGRIDAPALGTGTASTSTYLRGDNSWATVTATAANSAVTSVTGAYTALSSDSVILGNSTSAAFTVTLPTAVGNTGKSYTVKKTDASTNGVTVATTSAQTIDGGTTAVLKTQYLSLTVISDGANWQVI